MNDKIIELDQNNRMLNTLISNLPGMVARFKNNLDWTMEYLSEGCLHITGYTPEELVGNRLISYGKMTVPEDNLKAWEVIQEAVREKKRYQVEYRIFFKTGGIKWIWEQGIGIYDADGNLQFLEAFMTDITHQKKAEENLNDTINQLNDRNYELDTFTYRISHDLRAPLLTIYGLTGLMRRDTSLYTKEDYCDKIDNTVRKLEIFIKELMDYSKSKEYSENLTEIDFFKLIEDSFLESGYPEYKNMVYVTINNQLSNPILFESFRLKIILSNLLANAIKYRDTAKSLSNIDIRLQNTDETFIIEIADNGVGIYEKYQSNVFKMFYRATEMSDGSGLGLYIVKMNVEKMYGRIEMESELGVGTTFRLIFPLVCAL